MKSMYVRSWLYDTVFKAGIEHWHSTIIPSYFTRHYA